MRNARIIIIMGASKTKRRASFRKICCNTDKTTSKVLVTRQVQNIIMVAIKSTKRNSCSSYFLQHINHLQGRSREQECHNGKPKHSHVCTRTQGKSNCSICSMQNMEKEIEVERSHNSHGKCSQELFLSTHAQLRLTL